MSLRAASALLIGALAASAFAREPAAAIAPFSLAKPGKALPDGWRALELPRVPAPEFAVAEESGTTVLRSGRGGAGAKEVRDLEADFRAAFGAQWPGPVPRISGIAIGNDTDQTGETVTAWFGDFALQARR